MLNRVYIISEDYSFISNFPADSDVFLSWLVNPLEKKDLNEAYRYFSYCKNIKFCLSLKITNLLTEESIRSVISFLFNPLYLQIDESFVINITSSSESLLAETRKSLSSCTSQQGFENITINTVPTSEQHNNKGGNLLFNSVEKLIREYESILLNDDYFDNNIFLLSASEPAMSNVSASLLEIEKAYKKNKPGLFLLASENLRLKKEKRAIEVKYQLAENELYNQKEYADILRSTHTTRQLQDFYNNEYEVLPGWYKRFGHLIKAITGKRTFKSLFNDNVKKYKD